MTLERNKEGQLVCTICGATFTVDEAATALLEALEVHAETHLMPGESPDVARPRIWLR